MVKFLEAVLLLSGMIIGAGMFAIPFSFHAAGFWLGTAELILLSAVVLTLHLLYAEIVLATPQFHRLPGYIRLYLGRGAAAVSWASSVFGAGGTLLAYLILGAVFLQTIIAPLGKASHAALAVGLAVVVALITHFPLKKEAAINGFITIFEIAAVAGLSLFLLPRISPAALTGMHPAEMLAPYGVLLFALSGASVIPDLVTILGRRRGIIRAAVVIGSLLPVVLYFFFALGVVGVSGARVTPDAIAGLARAVGGNIALAASAAGFLAVFTSFVASSANVQAMLRLDLGLPRRSAWMLVSVLPVALYAVGIQDFIAIISVVGAVAFGIDGILFFCMGRVLRKKERIRRPAASAIGGIILAIILVGVVAELVHML